MSTAPAVCQKTFLASAPPVNVTLVAEAWVRVPTTWKIQTSPGPPERVTSRDMDTPVVQLWRPGERARRPIPPAPRLKTRGVLRPGPSVWESPHHAPPQSGGGRRAPCGEQDQPH